VALAIGDVLGQRGGLHAAPGLGSPRDRQQRPRAEPSRGGGGTQELAVRRSRFGGEAAAAWFSLIGSAKLHEVEPWAYLTDVTARLAHLGDAASDEELMPLLPDRWIAANPQARLPVSREPREQPGDGIERRRRFSNA
jgi:hypothetical protein